MKRDANTNKSLNAKTKKTKQAKGLIAIGEVNISNSQTEQLCQFRPIYEHGFSYATSLAYSNKIGNRDDAADLAQQTMVRVWKRINAGRETVTNIKGLVAHSFRYEFADWLEGNNHQRQLQKVCSRSKAKLSNHLAKTRIGTGAYTDYAYAPGRKPAPARGVSGKVYEFGETFGAEPIVMERLLDCDTLVEPEIAVIDNSIGDELQKALANLPLAWRQALVGQALEGRSLADLCDKYGWTLDQTKKYLGYAKRQMRLLLTGADPEVKPWHKLAKALGKKAA